MSLAVTKSRRVSNSTQVAVVPSGFDGFVISTPFTRSLHLPARWYASSRAVLVMQKLLELEQWTRTISTATAVRHLRSLWNLQLAAYN